MYPTRVPDAAALREALRALRQERGWRQDDLAELLAVPRQTVGSMESSTPTEAVQRLIDALGWMGHDLWIVPRGTHLHTEPSEPSEP